MDIPSCACERWEVRNYRDAGGKEHYAKQCLDCGANLGFVSKTRSPKPEAWFDPELHAAWGHKWEQYRRDRTAIQEHEQATRTSEWWHQYKAYLNTEQWAAKRAKVLQRDGYLCQACREQWATQAHHLTYAHLFREPLFDLVAVCKDCHDKLTGNNGE